MAGRWDGFRFWAPMLFIVPVCLWVLYNLIISHINPQVGGNNFNFSKPLVPRRGTIYCAGGRPVAESVPLWRYFLDPASISTPKLSMEISITNISTALGIPVRQIERMARRKSGKGWRHQFLAESDDPNVFSVIVNRKKVAGVAIEDIYRRRYLCGRTLSHVIGSVNYEGVGSCGIEQRFNSQLRGTPGRIEGFKDAMGREIRDRRTTSLNAIPGDSVMLTVDANLQYATEAALKWGIAEFGADSGWCIIMNVKTGAILSIASLPDFHPENYGKEEDKVKINRAMAYNYEPGSVMKVFTAAAAIEHGRATPNTLVNTDRYDERYYKLPGDGGHVWPKMMTMKDAIVHSSNIVMGKLGYDLGPQKILEAFRKFGFGERTGIELPGEQYGILRRDWQKWDKASWSRIPIGQGVSVTAIQLASAFQTLANDGVRMRPHIVESVVDAAGRKMYQGGGIVSDSVIKASTARKVREMMLGVSKYGGTARRARIKGYSIAGKTGTAQKARGGIYLPGLYCATYAGIIPSGLPQVDIDGAVHESDPEVVILVSLDFEHRAQYHQGGNSSAVVFRKLAKYAMRYLNVTPDRPDEIDVDGEEDEDYDIFEF